MPPMAAAIGSIAFRGSASSPTSSSRLISRPTAKKKIAMRPSLIQWRKSSCTNRSPNEMRNGTCNICSYPIAHGELAQTSAPPAQTSNRRAPDACHRAN
jgi:hypothetical protein